MLSKKYGRVPHTKATEFLSVEDLAVSPSADWGLGRLSGGTDIFIRFKINATLYFCSVDGTDTPGISGLLSPYPEVIVSKKFRLRPPIYVLPGQNFEVEIVHGELEFAPENPCKGILGCMEYIRYDGTDAVIAGKLLSAGLRITPGAINRYKEKVLSMGSGSVPTSDVVDEEVLAEFKEDIIDELRKEREMRKVKSAESIDDAVRKAVRRELEELWD